MLDITVASFELIGWSPHPKLAGENKNGQFIEQVNVFTAALLRELRYIAGYEMEE
ncbi:MAG: hypothetical protein AAGB04_20785 [Pseudomonadota bacterium]